MNTRKIDLFNTSELKECWFIDPGDNKTLRKHEGCMWNYHATFLVKVKKDYQYELTKTNVKGEGIRHRMKVVSFPKKPQIGDVGTSILSYSDGTEWAPFNTLESTEYLVLFLGYGEKDKTNDYKQIVKDITLIEYGIKPSNSNSTNNGQFGGGGKPLKNIKLFLYAKKVTKGTVTLSKPQVEVGTYATDWRPNPADATKSVEMMLKQIESVRKGGRKNGKKRD